MSEVISLETFIPCLPRRHTLLFSFHFAQLLRWVCPRGGPDLSPEFWTHAFSCLGHTSPRLCSRHLTLPPKWLLTVFPIGVSSVLLLKLTAEGSPVTPFSPTPHPAHQQTLPAQHSKSRMGPVSLWHLRIRPHLRPDGLISALPLARLVPATVTLQTVLDYTLDYSFFKHP